MSGGEIAGVIICKAERERDALRGYIAMLTVVDTYRKKGIGSALVLQAIQRMVDMGCEEVMLETEASNKGALSLYERLGFASDERLARYYLNGGDAFRLKLDRKNVGWGKIGSESVNFSGCHIHK